MSKGGPSAAIVGAARKRVFASARSLVDRGLVVGSSGNVSERIDPHHFVVTPAGVVYDRLRLVDISVVDQRTGECVEGMRPTSELALHLDLYRQDPMLKAIVHTHSRHAAAFAVARIDLPFIMNENIAMHAERILVTEYAPPGSVDLGTQALATFARQPGSRAILLANHGVVAIGDSVAEAELVAAQVEWIAEVVYLASNLRRDLGETVVLPHDMQDAIGHNYGVTFAREVLAKKRSTKK
jgi:L-ribulose-5-phosphate 4-epimerase